MQIIDFTLLAKRTLLSEKPTEIELMGSRVFLKPLVVKRDAALLFQISNGSQIERKERFIDSYDANTLIWQYMFEGPFTGLRSFSKSLQAQVNAPNGLCLCVFDRETQLPVGVVNYMNNLPVHLKIELGGIWYSPIAQRTGANLEATYLMLQHAFEQGYRRVEWKCDVLNERSRKAALKMGFTFEGIQESHFIVKGKNRDTAWYRILDREWDVVRKHLEKSLELARYKKV